MAKRRNRKLLVLSFFSEELRVVEGKWNKGQFSELKSAKFQIPDGLIEDGRVIDSMRMADIVKISLQQGQFNAKDAAVVINSAEIVIREINIPVVPEDEISSIVQFKLADMFQGNEENIDVSYLIVKKVIEEEIEKFILLIIAIPKDMVISYFNLLEQAGLTPELMEYQPNTTAKFLMSSNILPENEKELPVGILDVNNTETSFSIVKSGNLEAARYIPFGMNTLIQNITQLFSYDSIRVKTLISQIPDITAVYNDFSDESRFLNAVKTSLSGMLEEIEQVIRFYNSRRGNKPVNSILLAGSGIEINRIDEYISEFLSVPVKTIDEVVGTKEIDVRMFISLLGALIVRGE